MDTYTNATEEINMENLVFIPIIAALAIIPAFLMGAFAFSGVCLATSVVGACIAEMVSA